MAIKPHLRRRRAQHFAGRLGDLLEADCTPVLTKREAAEHNLDWPGNVVYFVIESGSLWGRVPIAKKVLFADDYDEDMENYLLATAIKVWQARLGDIQVEMVSQALREATRG